jgi:hypothetical protein
VDVLGAIAGILCVGGCCGLAALAIGVLAYVLMRKPSAPAPRAPAPIVEDVFPARPPVVEAPPIVEPAKVETPQVIDAAKAVVVEEVEPPKMVEATKAVVAQDAPPLPPPPLIDTGASLPPDRPIEPETFSSQTMIPMPHLSDGPPAGATIMVPPPVPLEGPDPAADVPEPPKTLGRSPTIVPEDVKPTDPGEE